MPTLEDDRFTKYENFFGGEYSYTTSDGEEKVILKEHLLDVPFIYSTITDTRNVICIDTNISKNTGSTKTMAVNLSVICHKNSLQLDNATRKIYKKYGYIGRNRLDIAIAIIGDILNGSNEFGIGRLTPVTINPTKTYYPNTEFFGKILDYSCDDFMIDYGKFRLDDEGLHIRINS